MPIIIPENLPATKTLQNENIVVMKELRAKTQDIRPLKIGILNLMPDKITTETQLLRKLSNSLIQIDITLITTSSYQGTHVSEEHLETFYRPFHAIKEEKFDALIITGAPIEHLVFEEVHYWKELKEIFDWCQSNVFTTLFICWASQAALYYYFGIEKEQLSQKLFGVFKHQRIDSHHLLFQGMAEHFWVPHSRNTRSNEKQIRQHPKLNILAESSEAGIHLISTQDNKFLFMAGHPEYDSNTLEKEYLRDLALDFVALPKNYYQEDDPKKPILSTWISDASLFYLNWLNHAVYQETNYDLGDI